MLSVWPYMAVLMISSARAYSTADRVEAKVDEDVYNPRSTKFGDVLYQVNQCASANSGDFIFPETVDGGTTSQRLEQMLQNGCSALPRVLSCIRESPMIVGGEHKDFVIAEVTRNYNAICDTEGFIRKVGIPSVGNVAVDCLKFYPISVDQVAERADIRVRMRSHYNENTTLSDALTVIGGDWDLIFNQFKSLVQERAPGTTQCAGSSWQDVFFVQTLIWMTRRIVPGLRFYPEQIAVLSGLDMGRRSVEWF